MQRTIMPNLVSFDLYLKKYANSAYIFNFETFLCNQSTYYSVNLFLFKETI